MKYVLSLGAVLCLLFCAALPARPQSNLLLQGTQVRLVLLNGLSTSVTRPGDPFLAIVAEPVYLGSQLVLPAGARVHGQVGNVFRPRRFSLFRGQAAMNLTFRSIELDRREIPARMSILSIQTPSPGQVNGKKRKDVKVEEGQVIEARPDIKGDVATVALAGGGGTFVGAVFSHVVRGLTLGLVGGTAYAIARKGKEVELPAQTSLLVRLDASVILPAAAASANAYRPSTQ